MGIAAAVRPTLIDSLRPHDPGLAGFRRAMRAALVMPAAFAFAAFVIRNPQLTTFVAFGCFSLIVVADFGGRRPQRAVAYLVTVAVGAVLLAVATLVSPIPWLAAMTMLVIGFAIQFSGVFGSYVTAAQNALMLAFVLAVSVPAPPIAVASRLEGWLIAGLVSTLAGLFLWPRFERLELGRKGAVACNALADLIATQRWSRDEAEIAQRRQRATAAVADMRETYRSTPHRPAGPTRRDRAFAEIVSEIERGLDWTAIPPAKSTLCLEQGDALAHAVVDTLRASAAAIEGGGPSPDLLALTAARMAHRDALQRWAIDSLRAHVPAEQVLDAIDADTALRILAYLALAIGSNVIVATGGEVSGEVRVPAGTPRHTGPRGVLIRVLRVIRTHLEPSSNVLHNSLRVGIGLGLAVLLARLLQLDHAFWVVLGTVSVLRTTALATGRTTVQAMVGTLLGFAVGSVFAVLAGPNPNLLWALLPFTVFLAAYAASAIGFVIGQAAFTLNIIILFNLIAPGGWRVGLARVEDVAVGTAVSLVVALLLWPRGARTELRRSLATLYRSIASYATVSMSRITDGGSHIDAERARRTAIRDRDRAGEAYDQLLNERGAKPMDPSRVALVVASGNHAILVTDFLNTVADKGDDARKCGEGADALRSETRTAVDGIMRLADEMRSRGTPAGDDGAPRISSETLRSGALRCLKQWKHDDETGRSAFTVITAAEYVRQLDALSATLAEPVAELARTSRVPWWR